MFHILLLLIYVIVLALSVRNLGRSPPKKRPENQSPSHNTGGGSRSGAHSGNVKPVHKPSPTGGIQEPSSNKPNNPADQGSSPAASAVQAADSVGGTDVNTVRDVEFPAAAGEPPQGGQGPQTSGQGGHGGHGGPRDGVEGGGGEGHPQTLPGEEVSHSSGYGYTRALSRQLRI
jgi:hypothetical protein